MFQEDVLMTFCKAVKERPLTFLDQRTCTAIIYRRRRWSVRPNCTLFRSPQNGLHLSPFLPFMVNWNYDAFTETTTNDPTDRDGPNMPPSVIEQACNLGLRVRKLLFPLWINKAPQYAKSPKGNVAALADLRDYS